MKKYIMLRYAIFLFSVFFVFQTRFAQNAYASAASKYYLQRTRYISVKDAGIIGDGKSDISDRLQQVVDKYDSVYFPKGNYFFGKPVSLKSNQVVFGDASANLVTMAVTTFNFFEIRSKENVKVTLLNFSGAESSNHACYATKIVNSRMISISKINATGCGLMAAVESEGVTYSAISNYKSGDKLTGSSNLSIEDCRGVGSESMMKNTVGILVQYVNIWKISNCSLKNYSHGVQWWGGDSDPRRNGDTTKERKTKNGVMENVVVDNVAGGGIWGSMGENIFVSNCTVSNAGDVGIDFEGCFNATARNNKVANCKNGCLTVFHYNKNILFDDNIVRQNKASSPLACIYNSTQRQDNGTIQFTNNNFSVEEGVGVILQKGPSSYIIFKNNTLKNVVINLNFNNNRIIDIVGNRITLTNPISNYVYVIAAGQTNNNGKLSIENNSIVSKIPQNDNIVGIYVYQADFNSSPVNVLRNNLIEGIKQKFRIEWKGANRGVASKTFIYSPSNLSNKDINKVDAGARVSELYINDQKQ
jgi:hypothetical protein